MRASGLPLSGRGGDEACIVDCFPILTIIKGSHIEEVERKRWAKQDILSHFCSSCGWAECALLRGATHLAEHFVERGHYGPYLYHASGGTLADLAPWRNDEPDVKEEV